ncbi:MAG: hypothetical protein M0R73_02450 [Dehalococcoidia bacterium]|nr:hypothetical protein [Dehalococcoidia bacterium]
MQRPPFSTAVTGLRYFAGPEYQAMENQAAGGAHSRATLGPDALLGMGSDANASLPAAIRDARAKYPEMNFKAGHLLNADFGGNGDEAANLTILTAQANAAHKGFDNPVKRAVDALRKAYEAMWDDGIDISGEQIGIAVSIQVGGGAWGDDYPDNCIFNELRCTATLVGAPSEEFHDERFKAAFDEAIATAITECGLATASGTVANSKAPVEANDEMEMDLVQP